MHILPCFECGSDCHKTGNETEEPIRYNGIEIIRVWVEWACEGCGYCFNVERHPADVQ
jgi:hypothetical protein